MTFYRTLEELPEFTDYSMKGRTYRYMENEALYPFGYGLSYTSFELTDVCLDTDTIAAGGSVAVTASLKNTGDSGGQRDGSGICKGAASRHAERPAKGAEKIIPPAGRKKAGGDHAG